VANEFLNPVVIAQESLMRLENELTFFKMVSREFDDKFALPGNKIGYVYNARMPVRFRGRQGDEMRPEDIRETSVPITIDRLWGVDLDCSDQDLTMSIDRFSERFIQPAVQTIANNIDREGLALYKNVYNHVGTPGTTPTSVATYVDAGVALDDMACPQGSMRAVVITPRMQGSVLGFGANLFNPADTISKQYETGTMGKAVGFKFNMDQNVARHTVGTLTGSTPLVNGANQSGNSLVTDGWANSTLVLKDGEIISVADVNGVNPISYSDYGVRRTFTVVGDVTSDGSGNATIVVSPDINASTDSPFQTVTALPANDAAIFVFNVAAAAFANITGASTPQALAFHKNAFALAIVNLELPGGMEWSERASNPKIGLSVRLVRGYDVRLNRKYTRLDVLGGWKCVRPELACRISG